MSTWCSRFNYIEITYNCVRLFLCDMKFFQQLFLEFLICSGSFQMLVKEKAEENLPDAYMLTHIIADSDKFI